MSSKNCLSEKWRYSRSEYFSTLLPPPNLTGTLHLGHMWNAILQDTLMRCHRKFLYTEDRNGNIVDLCYWAAGVDHAGISLQIRVEEELRKEGKSKSDLSSDEFKNRLEDWAEARRKDILRQYKGLGYSFDSDNEEIFKYTLSEDSVNFCRNVFEQLFRNGLIYRSKKLVNWDTKLKTAISDAEVEYRPVLSKIYTLKYFYSEEEYIPVATTRPETIFGDVAVFVHPEDERYIHLIGKEVTVPIVNRKVKVIADEYVDRDFGTGAMKCTPAHDFDDEDLGKKHNLEFIQVFGEDLIMSVGPYKGKIYSEVREKIVCDLRESNLLDKEEDCQSNVAYSARSGAIVEPLMSTQWFLRSSRMAYDAWLYWRDHRHEMEVVNPSYRGRLEIILKNTEDWCISRQLEWGIKIPAFVGERSETSLEEKEGFRPCEDVLDTWFSSSLWPFLAMNCENENLSEKYGSMPTFPISALVSGKDILLFWISRMVFMCYFLKGQLPFKKIFLHGLILDAKKRKMSKSLNNGVDPLQLIGKKLDDNVVISHDAIRLFFLSNTHDGNDIVFSEAKLKYFCNILHKFDKAYEFYKKEEAEYSNGKNKVDFNSSLNKYEDVVLREVRSAAFELASNIREFNFSKAVDKALFFFKECFFNRYLATYKLFRKAKKHNFQFLKYIWWRMMDMFEMLIPNFFNEWNKYLDAHVEGFGKELIGEWDSVHVNSSNLSWWFEYLKIFTDLDNRLKFSDHLPIETIVYSDVKLDLKEVEEYLSLIGHNVRDIRNLSDRKISSQQEDVIIVTINSGNMNMIFELKLCDKDKATQYRKLVKEEADWLKKEIDFLTNRLSGFNYQTPQSLRDEVQDKLNRYKGDLLRYEINYGV